MKVDFRIDWKNAIKTSLIIFIILGIIYTIDKVKDHENLYPTILIASITLTTLSSTLIFKSHGNEFKHKQQTQVRKQWKKILPKIEKAIKNLKLNLKVKNVVEQDTTSNRKNLYESVETIDTFESDVQCQVFSIHSAVSFFAAFLLFLVDFLSETPALLLGFGISFRVMGLVLFWFGILSLVRFGFGYFNIYSKK